eukprot:520286_1
MSTESKETDNSSKVYVTTSLIDVICKLSSYIPKCRISKWSTNLAKEDLDYLIDLLIIPHNALGLSRFSTRLYGELLRIRQLPIIQMKIISTESDIKDEITSRKAWEGSYIDIGDKLNNERVFIHVSGDGGIKDLNQRILYNGIDNRWRFYVVSNSQKGYYMMISNESKETHFEQLTWIYVGKAQKEVSITLYIKQWNV